MSSPRRRRRPIVDSDKAQPNEEAVSALRVAEGLRVLRAVAPMVRDFVVASSLCGLPGPTEGEER